MTNNTQHAPIHTGGSFADFMDEQGIRNEVEAIAMERVLAWQSEQARQRAAEARAELGIL
jgi:antitoxin HicB